MHKKIAKNQRNQRTRLTGTQSEYLKYCFKNSWYPNAAEKKMMANTLNLTYKFIQTWFQNTRAFHRKKFKMYEITDKYKKQIIAHNNNFPPSINDFKYELEYSNFFYDSSPQVAFNNNNYYKFERYNPFPLGQKTLDFPFHSKISGFYVKDENLDSKHEKSIL